MMAVVLPVLIVVALLLLNGLFVAAEFAIISAPRPTIERLAADGNRAARRVAAVLRDPQERDRFIATAQLGITLASLGLGMYGEHLLAEWLAGVFEGFGAARWVAAHTLGSIVAVAILTYFHIVIGEMVPKSIALQQPERTSLWITPVVRVAQTATYPLIVVLNAVGDALLRAVRMRRDPGHDEYRTPEELGYLVREAQEGGLLRSGAARIVAELLDFGALTAREVMVPRVRVTGIPLGASADAMRRVLRDAPHTRYPVYDGTIDHVVGMMHVKDILRCLPHCDALTEAQTRRVPIVPETATVDQVMSAMREARAQMAVVVDEHGGTAGIVTVEDLFEEVVGDVGDEAATAAELSRAPDGTMRAAGTVRLDVLGDALGVELTHDAVDSVSGLVLMLLGRPPRVGDVVSFEGVRLEVTRVAHHGVGEVRAALPRGR